MVAVNVENVNFKYSKEDVLKKISLEVPKGSFVCILGPNGSGKTTLLKNICSLLKPNDGHILVGEKALNSYRQKELAKNLAVVHQTQTTEFDFKVEDVVLMGRYPHIKSFQTEKMKDYEVAEQSMKHTSVFHLKDKSLQSISGGERQRVMIARALTQESELLLLDEPISHLDIKYQLEILKLCQILKKEKKITIVATLHDINLASRFSDLIVLMKEGEIVEIGTPRDVITLKNIQHVYDVKVELMEHLSFPMVVPS